MNPQRQHPEMRGDVEEEVYLLAARGQAPKYLPLWQVARPMQQMVYVFAGRSIERGDGGEGTRAGASSESPGAEILAATAARMD
jgi:hypothetical protein